MTTSETPAGLPGAASDTAGPASAGPASARPVLELSDVTKTYVLDGVEVHALCGVSVEVREGDMLSIMGPSGSGKSTLMHIIGLLDHPTSGSVSIEGQNVVGMTANELAAVRNKRIGFVFQSFNLLARTGAQANVELPLVYAGIAAPERARRAREALAGVDLGDRLKHTPSQLSGGQQQRVAIARAIATEPAVLLADEPTGNLDTQRSQEIMALLAALNVEHGITVLMVTHEPDMAAYARRLVHFVDGNIASDVPNDHPVAAAVAVAAATA